ncbi:MAG: ABC transporter ATP-binding protein [Candidatus Hydrogenedentota bacterium]
MPLLCVENLVKSYRSPDGQLSRIVDIDRFEVDAGEQIAVKGASGSGKTTFLNLIAGILRPDSGRIELDGHDMAGQSESGRDRIRASRLGYVFQTFNLLQGYTAFENVLLGMMFGPGADPGYAESLLKRVGLADRMNYRPRQLSVGQQQRVAVARALANRPKLVLADEPTGNLDRHHAREALQLIREICRENGAALLLVSHDPDILDAFERRHDFEQINRVLREESPA